MINLRADRQDGPYFICQVSMMKIAPSILSADMGRLAEEIKAMETAGVDWIHLDIMDGHFVPNITFGPWVVSTARKCTKLFLDAHLMISDPLTYGPVCAKNGADLVTFHVEATPHLNKGLAQIKESGAQAGLVLNPSTPVVTLKHCLPYLDVVLIMGVNPGFSGQAFIPETIKKVAELKRFIAAEADHEILIEVDGGVTDQNAGLLAAAGAGALVSGSHLFGAADYGQAVTRLRAAAQANV